jgi:hypothetical protein
MQIDGEGIDNLLMNMVLISFYKRQKFRKTPFHTLFPKEWLKFFVIWNYPNDDNGYDP